MLTTPVRRPHSEVTGGELIPSLLDRALTRSRRLGIARGDGGAKQPKVPAALAAGMAAEGAARNTKSRYHGSRSARQGMMPSFRKRESETAIGRGGGIQLIPGRDYDMVETCRHG